MTQQRLLKQVLLFTNLFLVFGCSLLETAQQEKIDRQALVARHNPVVEAVDRSNPLTIGNGRFAYTADVTGFQSFYSLYYKEGIPLETKARWAWHTRANTKNYRLADAEVKYDAYGREVKFPTNMDAAAGQWLRKNPHDLPLARLGLLFNGRAIKPSELGEVQQKLDMWQGLLSSRYSLRSKKISVSAVAHPQQDLLAYKIESPWLAEKKLSFDLQFPRAYKLDKKNTPEINWDSNDEHKTTLIEKTENRVLFKREVDNHRHWVQVTWQGKAEILKKGEHRYELVPHSKAFEFNLAFFQNNPGKGNHIKFGQVKSVTKKYWQSFWQSGATVEFSESELKKAKELERRVVLSQYLLAVQAKAKIPAQETGLTSSSWYGKHHTEMTWWHTAHWILWNRPEQAQQVLAWYLKVMPAAKALAKSRGLEGARWSKMVGPEGRESPGGNPLIIWNQPQPIHLAEMLYQQNPSKDVLNRYAGLVEESAEALSSMLVWEASKKRYSLFPPIWIAQEIYEPTKTINPTFELSYWRYGLQVAQTWRTRLGKAENPEWNKQLKHLAALPIKDQKYVAIESIPDTFDNIESRKDHPTMLAPWGLLADETVDIQTMKNTYHAVLKSWDWEKKIWGWDYPMIAMTALKLGDTEKVMELLTMDAPHNRYLKNGHCPQPGASLPVYLPANGALLAAVAMMAQNQNHQKLWGMSAEGF